MAQSSIAADPILVTLASAFRIGMIDDAAAGRAIDRAVEHLASGLPYDFDGVELRITSHSRRDAGFVQVTDGQACTCESSHRAWCWHRAAYRLLLASMALQQPGYLRAKILEQCSPIDSGAVEEGAWDEYGDFLAQPAQEVRPVAGSRFAAAQSAADSYFS